MRKKVPLDQVKFLIAENRLKESIDLILSTDLSKMFYKELLLLSLRLKSIEDLNLKGITSRSENNSELNSIRSSFLSIISAIESETEFRKRKGINLKINSSVILYLVALSLLGVFLVIGISNLRQLNEKIDLQNQLIAKQTTELDRQSVLLESDRRGAIILEGGKVLDALDKELKQNPNQGSRTLSPSLIGRVIALSRAYKEYKYIDPTTDTITRVPLSPERGHLLISLYNSKLDSNTFSTIIKGADFSNADLQDANLIKSNLNGVFLPNANLQGAKLYRSYMVESNLQSANLKYSFLYVTNLSKSNLRNTNLQGAKLQSANLKKTDLRDANLREADIRDANLDSTLLEGADLQHCIVTKDQIPQLLLAKADTTRIIIKELPPPPIILQVN